MPAFDDDAHGASTSQSPSVHRGDPLHFKDGVGGQLLHDPEAMRLYRAPRDEQGRGDLVVRAPTNEKLKDLVLAAGQALERSRGRARG